MIITPELKSIIDRIKTAVHAYHMHFTDEFLDSLSVYDLLSYAHPIDRNDFTNEIDSYNRKMKKEHDRK